jgi:hypothetical protein
MSSSEVYRQALAKHDWAEKHIEKLRITIADFGKVDPCIIRKEIDPKTGDVTYYVVSVPPIPGEVPLIMGDVLHNLRCALDYVACGLVGPACVTSKTKFPIRRDPKDWEVSGLRMVDGASQEAIEALRRIRPYEGGNSLLYVLHTLNNIDKHRLLLTTTLKNIARTTREREQVVGNLLDEKRPIVTGDDFPKVPLHAGQKLLTVPASEVKEDVGFLLDVAFTESEPAKRMPVVITLELVGVAVGKTIRELARFLP